MSTVIPAMESKTIDIVADNVIKLKELFPEAFTEGKVDFDALKEVLGEYIDGRDERYSFTWNGKSKARMIAQTPSTGTLRPCKEESVAWDTTQNLFIEGDNLEVLKLLQKSYHKKVKVIYIDPPYNTGKDFVYKDNFKDNIKNYKEITGQVDGEGRNLTNNPETSGRYHSDWLNMMYPRLKLARNLLKNDGLIFISIDDNEISNLRAIADEVFGEENFCGTFIVRSTPNARNYGHIGKMHEYCLMYSRSIDHAVSYELERDEVNFSFNDSIGGYNIHPLYNSDESFSIDNRPNLHFPLYINPDSVDENGHFLVSVEKNDDFRVEVFPPLSGKNKVQFVWRWSKEKVEDFGFEVVGHKVGEDYRISRKMRHTSAIIRSMLIDKKYSGRVGTGEVEGLLGSKIFSFPKPVSLLKELVKISSKDSDMILDFFSGSCTTAHATMEVNAEDKGKRRFVMVQLPEATDAKSAAFKAGYNSIAEISVERIRRSAANIKEENPDYDGDLGFKVFKLDSTNIKPWEVDFDLTEQDLEDQISNIKHGRREEDVLYEVLLKYGLDLTFPITEHTVEGHKVFDIGMGALMICLSDDISLEVVEGIAKLKDELAPEIMRVVFKDAGFADDVVKTNAVQILKQAGIEDVRSL